MKKGIFKKVLSFVLVLCMAMPSSLLTAMAEESYVVVDDTVTDNTLDHYFTYTEDTDTDGLTGWASDTKSTISTVGVTNDAGNDVAQTQHWVWNEDYTEASKHTYTFTFKGTGVEIVGVKNDDQNTFQLDDEAAETVTITGASNTPVTLYSKTGLDYGTHTVSATLPEGGTGLQVCYAKVYETETDTVTYEYEAVSVVNPTSNSWHVTSATDGDGPAAWAFDGDSDTRWHSNYTADVTENGVVTNTLSSNLTWGTVSTIPAFTEVSASRAWVGGEFERAINLGKLVYTGRADANKNWMGQYALYIANVASGTEVTDADFTCVYNGTNSAYSAVTMQLDTPVTATHFRLVAFSATVSNFATASEIEIYEATVADTTPVLFGGIADTDTQWTDDRGSAVKKLSKDSEILTGWKNDTVTSEIALYAQNSTYTNVTVTTNALTDGEGNEIPAEAVFIRSTKAYNGTFVGYGSNNDSDDYPADDGSNRSESADIIWKADPVSMESNTVQPIWVEFDIPADAAAGTYTGTISVTADELTEAMTFNYTVEVLDATLPDATEFVNTFDIMQWQHPYNSAEYYGVDPFSDDHLAILEDIMSLYKEVGGNAITGTIMEESWNAQTYSENDIHYPSMVTWTKNSDGTFSYDYSDLDAWLTLCTNMGLGEKITLYGIAPWHNSFKYWEDGTLQTLTFSAAGTTTYNEMWTDFLTDLIAHLEANGWFDNVYLGVDERGVSEDVFALVESVTNSEGVSLKTAADIDNITNHWEIAQNVTDLNVGDTAAQNYATQFAELVEIRDAKGYKTTLYSCTEHQPGQFSLSAPVESYWAVVNAGMMGADGFNRWAYDAWVEDPLNDTTHYGFEPGDCFVIFPDEKTAENPEAYYSVRLARMAEGIRDVNKLALIAKEIPALSDEVEAVYDNIQYTLITTNAAYMSDSAVQTLAAETISFKADLNELTEAYILMRDGGTNEVESVVINEGSSLSLSMGSTQQLTTTMTPDNLIDTSATWSSSDDNVVSVDANGEITALQIGSAVITATSVADSTKTAEITITVTEVAIADSKKVAYYSFDNVTGTELVNEWADDRNGTIADSATTVEGKQGNALSVNTAGEGAVITDSSDLDDADWTVGYWVKATSTFDQEISALEDAAKVNSLSLRLASDRTNGGFRTGDDSGDVLTYNYTFAQDTWYHLTWVQDKSVGLTLYVNGTAVQTNTWTAGNDIAAPIEVIGGTGFTGLIDEVKIYNAVLTEEEIAASMQVKGINLAESSVEVYLDDTYQIAATIISDEADKTLTYTSADPAIASVDSNGLVTGVGRGRTTITIRNEASGYEATVSVKVSVETSILNELPLYILEEQYQSDVEGPHADDASMRYLGQPDMVQTETGRLITVFPVGHGHGPLIMKYSDDEGETWTEMPNTPESWDDSQETPTIYSLKVDDGNGGLKERLVLICACPGTWGNYTTGWDFSYSDNNGETWTEFEHFWSEFSDGTTNDVIVGMASLIQLKDEDGNDIQKWMGVYHNGTFVNYKTYLTFDSEGNPEWTEPIAYLSDYRTIESSHQICEVGMFRSPDEKRIVALARNQTHTGPATMFYSDDEGETWTEPVELPGSLAGERHKAKYDPISGRLVITFREIDYDRDNDGVWEGGSDWIAGDWVAWVGSYDDLMNLQQGDYMIRLDEDFAANYYSGDTGYTGMAVLGDGTFVLHSYGHWDEAYSKSYVDSSTGAYNVKTDLCWIRQAKFKLADVENAEGLIDYASLENCVNDVQNTSSDGYTEESFAEFETALNAAQTILTNRNVQQVEVDAATTALQAAISGLEEKPEETPTEDVTEIFADVTEGTWYVPYVQYVYENNIMSGNEGLFTPNASVTRAMVVETLYKLEGRPEVTDYTEFDQLTDLSRNDWWAASVAWALNTDVATGDTYNLLFNPEASVTREQLATFLYRYANLKDLDTTQAGELLEMLNSDQVSAFALEAVEWAVGANVINGIESTDENGNVVYDLAPQAGAIRAELATILTRFCQKYSI